MRQHAVVLFSGGMDSTIALYWAIHNPGMVSVSGLCIDYGQTHKAECDCAARVWRAAKKVAGDKLGKLRTIKLPAGTFAGAASILGDGPIDTYENVTEAQKHNQDDASYVPLRNAVFCALAANQLLVESRERGGTVVTGFRGRPGEGGGFPDGTPQFSDVLSAAFTTGAAKNVMVYDPLNRPGRSRLDALKLAETLPGAMEGLSYSMTCFQGTEPPCGKCLPCLRRAEGFEQYGQPDPLLVRLHAEKEAL